MLYYRYSFYELISDFNVLLGGTNEKIGVSIILFVKIFTNEKKFLKNKLFTFGYYFTLNEQIENNNFNCDNDTFQ